MAIVITSSLRAIERWANNEEGHFEFREDGKYIWHLPESMEESDKLDLYCVFEEKLNRLGLQSSVHVEHDCISGEIGQQPEPPKEPFNLMACKPEEAVSFLEEEPLLDPDDLRFALINAFQKIGTLQRQVERLERGLHRHMEED